MDVSVLILHWYQAPIPVGGPQFGPLRELEGLGLKRRRLACVPHLLKDGLVLGMGKQFKVVAAEQFLFAIARALGIGGVDPKEVELRVEVSQLGMGALHDRLQHIPFPLQGRGHFLQVCSRLGDLRQQPLAFFLRPFALGDIYPITDDLKGLPLLVSHQFHLVTHPDVCAVFTSKAVFIGMMSLFKYPWQFGQNALHIFRMDVIDPEARFLEKLSRLIADHLTDVVTDKGGSIIAQSFCCIDDRRGGEKERL